MSWTPPDSELNTTPAVRDVSSTDDLRDSAWTINLSGGQVPASATVLAFNHFGGAAMTDDIVTGDASVSDITETACTVSQQQLSGFVAGIKYRLHIVVTMTSGADITWYSYLDCEN